MDKRENEYVLWFDELRRADVGLVGGKSSSLGELTSATKVPVPYGYATTANAYRYFMDVTGQNKKIHELLEGLDGRRQRRTSRSLHTHPSEHHGR